MDAAVRGGAVVMPSLVGASGVAGAVTACTEKVKAEATIAETTVFIKTWYWHGRGRVSARRRRL